jgi:hypothetical protein
VQSLLTVSVDGNRREGQLREPDGDGDRRQRVVECARTAVPHHNRAGVVYGTLGAFILAALASGGCEAGRWRWQLRRGRQGSAALATPPPTRASPALSRSLPSSLTSAPTLFITWDPTAPANLFTLYRLDVLLLFTFILPPSFIHSPPPPRSSISTSLSFLTLTVSTQHF